MGKARTPMSALLLRRRSPSGIAGVQSEARPIDSRHEAQPHQSGIDVGLPDARFRAVLRSRTCRT
jgi:hypothetical protein